MLVALMLLGISADSQELIYSEPVEIFVGDTVKVINYEHLLKRELLLDEGHMKGRYSTSSFDTEDIEHYRLSAMCATTEFVALEHVERRFGNRYFTMRNLVTGEIYGIQLLKNVRLDHYIVNLSGQRRVARAQYEHNLMAEKGIRGECDTRISIRPYDIDSDIAVWNGKRIIVINGIEYSFADITGCSADSMEVYRPAKIDHDKVAKNLKKKSGWGGLIGGEIGAVAGSVWAAAQTVSDAAKETVLVTEYVVKITTGLGARPVIEINIGEDKAKADRVVELIGTVVASN